MAPRARVNSCRAGVTSWRAGRTIGALAGLRLAQLQYRAMRAATDRPWRATTAQQAGERTRAGRQHDRVGTKLAGAVGQDALPVAAHQLQMRRNVEQRAGVKQLLPCMLAHHPVPVSDRDAAVGARAARRRQLDDGRHGELRARVAGKSSAGAERLIGARSAVVGDQYVLVGHASR